MAVLHERRMTQQALDVERARQHPFHQQQDPPGVTQLLCNLLAAYDMVAMRDAADDDIVSLLGGLLHVSVLSLDWRKLHLPMRCVSLLPLNNWLQVASGGLFCTKSRL